MQLSLKHGSLRIAWQILHGVGNRGRPGTDVVCYWQCGLRRISLFFPCIESKYSSGSTHISAFT